VLLDYLRKDLKLTGAKQSCDRKGQCGACTVIVNGRAVRSCSTKMARLDGADIITVEGLGTPDNPHLIQEAFVLSGAIQCGFCTPGMILASKALLDRNNNPSKEDIKRALAGNLCRCTGYKKIIEAVELAGKFIRGETTPGAVKAALPKANIGVSYPRPTAMVKACGLAKFNDDIDLGPDTLELAQVHSTEGHALIKNIDISEALKMPGVVGVMLAKDIKGTNHIRVAFPDQPVLCEDKVRTYGDPIAAVAAKTRAQARAAAAAVKVTYEKLPLMMTVQEAMAPGAYQIHAHAPGNLVGTQPLVKGDADKAFAEAKYIVEAEFATQTNHQAPLEPEICSAYFEGIGENRQLVIIGRSINIHVHLAQIKEAVGNNNMRYIEAYSGGQFGIKNHVNTEPVTAAAAMYFQKPIRYVPSLAESMQISSKRYAYPIQKMKMGTDASGHITAFQYYFWMDKGAYTVAASPAGRVLAMISSSYWIPNIKAQGWTIYTNNASGGSARGAGPPESIFPMESMIDMMAEKVGMDPLEFRKLNALKLGQSKSIGEIPKQWTYDQVVDAMKPWWEDAKKRAAAWNAKNKVIKHGVGIGGHSFGVGGAGDKSEMSVQIEPDGGISIFAAVADPGEGDDALMTQIAAERMGIPRDKVRLYVRDTHETVGMGPSAGSRMTLMAGNSLIAAIDNLKKALAETVTQSYAGLKTAGKPTRYAGTYNSPGPAGLDSKTGQGKSYNYEVQNLQLVEVEVNTETGAVKVLKIWTVVDAGTVINYQAIEGQLEGGMDQGVGYALREEYIHGQTSDWINFKFPKIADSYDVEIKFVQVPREGAPLGAIGVGEMTMNSTAPAVTNAIYNACGARIYKIPATPDKVLAAIAAKK
jgi:aldehyde oxidoreductase